MRYPRVLKALGTILLIFSVTLLVPLFGSLVWDEEVRPSTTTNPFNDSDIPQTTIAFLATLLLTVLLGLVLVVVPRETLEELRERESFAIVGFSYLGLSLLGSIPFLLTGVTRSPITALFETMSGLTTTGATALALPLEQYPASIHLWRSTLQFLGGMGIIVLSIAVLQRMTEGAYKLMSMEAPGGTVTRIKPKITQTAKALWTLYVFLVLSEFAILVPLMHFTGQKLPWKTSIFDALCTAMSTLSTGGFSPRTDSIGFYGSTAITWVVLFFIILGGVNFNLYWIASHGQPGRLFRDPEFRYYIGILVFAWVAVALALYWDGVETSDAVAQSLFHSSSFMTTTGFTTTNHDAFPDLAKMLLLLVMFTGACTGSTAGGLKVLRIQLLVSLTSREVLKLLHPHAVSTVKVAGRILPEDTIRRVVVFFYSFLTIFIMGAVGFIALGFPLVDGIASSIALLSNVGPSFGLAAFSFQDVGPAAQVLGYALMWLGRLEIFTVLLLFVPATYRD